MENYNRKETDSFGTYYFLDDLFHRTDGPAIDYSNGYKAWYINNKLHRTDGPAVEFADGHKAWYLNGKYHRTDGPAIVYVNGDKYWYINGEFIGSSIKGFTQEKFEQYKNK